jgi:hypothetical protein
MKTPVIVLGEVLFPGLTPTLDLPRATVAALAAWQKTLGFGALDVLLVPSSDPARPPGADNALRVGVLASLALPDGWEQVGELVPVELLESFRVKLKAPPTPNPKGWGGLEAEFIPAAPKAHGWDEGAQKHLRRLLHEWMLAAPQEVMGHLDEPELVPAVLLPALELSQAPAWATVYAAALATGADLAHRKALLEADELGAEAARLETLLRDKLALLPHADRAAQATLASALEQGVEGGLVAASEALEALAALDKLGAIQIDKNLREKMKKLRRELERLIPEAQKLIAEFAGDEDEDDTDDE